MTKRRVLITGCDKGLGSEFARQYAADSWAVHATYMNAAARIDGADISVHHVLDVTDGSSVAAVAAELDGVAFDLVISNAGLMSDANPFGGYNYAAISRLFDTNTIGALRIAEAFTPNLERAGRAKLVFVSSRMGSIGSNITGGHIGYRASKAALNAIGRTLAVELFSRGISVLMIHPGWVATENGGPAAPMTSDQSVRAMRARIAELGSHETGQFITYAGKPIPW